MRLIFAYSSMLLLILISSCSENKLEKKGFQVSQITEDEEGKKIVGLPIDSLNLETRPRNVLATKSKAHRLTPIFKVNYHKKTKKPFIGSNAFHSTWYRDQEKGTNWNNNFMPGFSAMYGYNLVNVSIFNNLSQKQVKLFTKPVLINTLYYPANSNDSINFIPVERNFLMVSLYNEDTNKDGFINRRDLRRMQWFDQEGQAKGDLIPRNYSVMNSEYDEDNDVMYVFARLDQNKNGKMDSEEPIHIFWIDLKNPSNTGITFN